MRIFLTGFMGSGKSYAGKRLAERLDFSFIDLDEYLEEKENCSISSIFQEKGEAHFRNLERQYLHEMIQYEQIIISTGGGTPCFFDNMNWINNNGVSIFLQTSVEVIVQRLQKEKDHRPLIAGLSKEELSQFVSQKLEDLTTEQINIVKKTFAFPDLKNIHDDQITCVRFTPDEKGIVTTSKYWFYFLINLEITQ